MTTNPDLQSFAALHDKLALTQAALMTHPDDAELARLATWLGGMVEGWESIEAAGRALKKHALSTAAHVRVADAMLDHALGAFAASLLNRLQNDTAQPLYRRFFPEPHEDVIDLGLDAELPVAAHIVMLLEQDETLDASLREHRKGLAAVVALGNRALAARADALADLGRHQARVEGWIESAACMHKSVARSLGRIADQRGLPARWVAAFV